MQNKKKILYEITNNKKFSINVFEPFDNKVINFLNDFSNELKKTKKIYKFPDLFYLVFWCNYKNIQKIKKKFSDEKIRLGRGLVFHICPSNVPTNFIYLTFIIILFIPTDATHCLLLAYVLQIHFSISSTSPSVG